MKSETATGKGTSATGNGVCVSVIVAVHNMREHIRQCIESVLNQSFRDLELILVDDVSTDGTAEILREYALRDHRVNIVWQSSNGGAQLARNAGVEVSHGEYIITLDPDDFLAPDALQLAVETFRSNRDVQCVCLREIRLLPDGNLLEHREKNSFGLISGMEAYRRSIRWKGITGRMMVRREMQLRYPFDNCERVYGEDNTAQLQFLASSAVQSCEGIYYHRLLNSSLSHSISLNNIRGNLRFISMREQLHKGNFGREVLCLNETAFWESIVESYQYYCLYRKKLSETEHNEALQTIYLMWKSAEMGMVSTGVRYKPGFMHMPTWGLFRLQVSTYMAIKSMVKGKPTTLE